MKGYVFIEKIDDILEEFLIEQQARLKQPRTYNDYDEVIYFFS
ncbi:hypothetical protein [Bacillus andreraoultii]|nr:hypothetical protein [Bacillus andreraoultii]